MSCWKGPFQLKGKGRRPVPDFAKTFPGETVVRSEREQGSRGPIWPILLTCFFLSGVAGLVYQVAWTRQFALVFGSSELAVAAVLAAFLGGLGAGAAVAAGLVGRISRPVLLYALLELVIAVSALAVPWLVRLSEHLFVGLFGMQDVLPSSGGVAVISFDLAAAFAVLAVPTMCMGATLPLLARFAVREEREIGPVTGTLYAVNTAGAVLGAPLAAFVLLPEVGLGGTVTVAVGLNLLASAVALVIGMTAGGPKRESVVGSDGRPSQRVSRGCRRVREKDISRNTQVYPGGR